MSKIIWTKYIYSKLQGWFSNSEIWICQFFIIIFNICFSKFKTWLPTPIANPIYWGIFSSKKCAWTGVHRLARYGARNDHEPASKLGRSGRRPFQQQRCRNWILRNFAVGVLWRGGSRKQCWWAGAFSDCWCSRSYHREALIEVRDRDRVVWWVLVLVVCKSRLQESRIQDAPGWSSSPP